jgi:dihydroneopterin aldolase
MDDPGEGARRPGVVPDVAFVRGLGLSFAIGVEPFEIGRTQTVVVSSRMEVSPELRRTRAHLAHSHVVEHPIALGASGRHFDPMEDVAESAARKAPEVRRVEVVVETPDVFPEALAVGCTIVVARGSRTARRGLRAGRTGGARHTSTAPAAPTPSCIAAFDSSILLWAWPDGIIGKQFSCFSTTQSKITGPSWPSISMMA